MKAKNSDPDSRADIEALFLQIASDTAESEHRREALRADIKAGFDRIERSLNAVMEKWESIIRARRAGSVQIRRRFKAMS